ncbi:hypothetical protein NDU88_002388 [Pleurodeles waltl]|uniref:Uncharacterized protein n=1 Tax=Pleurodeles waltl TaxID=8319 RepID=A0AAV7Q6R2_PLEWA|nr:hypothetical protein NDU88_002388 [Pleurodeles waltl]
MAARKKSDGEVDEVMVVPRGGQSRVDIAPPAAAASLERRPNWAQPERAGPSRGKVVVHPGGMLEEWAEIWRQRFSVFRIMLFIKYKLGRKRVRRKKFIHSCAQQNNLSSCIQFF